MLCKKCGKKLIVKRNFVELLRSKMYYLCDYCYKMYPINIAQVELQLDNYKCVIMSMFKNKHYIDYNFFIYEYNYIIGFINKNNNYSFLFFNDFELSDFNIGVLDCYSRLLKSDLLILTFYLKK